MKEIILEYLNDEFYYSTVHNCVFSVSNDHQKIGYGQIERLIGKIFGIDEDLAHAIVFNWLLVCGVKLVKKNWNKTYMVHNKDVMVMYENKTVTEDIDFIYKLVPNEE